MKIYISSFVLGSLLLASSALGAGSLSLSQNNVNLNVGQSVTISAFPPSGQAVNVTSITNSFVAYANVSGSQITIHGLGNGNTVITLCTYDNYCGTVNVTVGSEGNTGGQISFSQNNINLTTNQTATVNVFNAGSGSIYISNNSNSNVVSAFVSGNTIQLTGQNTGSSAITVCASNVTCGTLNVSVNSGGIGLISFSQNNVNLNISQSQNITIANSTGNSLFISSNSNPSAVNAVLSGNLISVLGLNTGFASINVCATNSSTCAVLNVFVNQGSGGLISFSQNNLSINQNQNTSVTVFTTSGQNSGFYIASNSNPGVVNATISGNLITLLGTGTGNSNIQVCTTTTNCGTLFVSVNSNNQGNLFFSTTSLPQPRVNQYYQQQLSVFGGTAPYNYSLSSGSLPSGLSLATSGLIFGTPTNTFTHTFTIRVNDNFGRSAFQSFTLTPTSGIVGGTLIYNNGTLINDNGTIYITYKNTISGFGNMQAFSGLGFKLQNVINASTFNLNRTNFIVNSSAMSHPWGSWIKNGSTIYFVHETGLIPIPTFDIFISNGGNIASVVNANVYDMNLLQHQPVMTYNDFRLK